MKKSLVIFDLEIASYIGNGINKLFERALPEASRSQEEVLRIRSLFLPYYGEHCADMTRPFEGIPELLSDICRQGIKVAVASNKYHPATVGGTPQAGAGDSMGHSPRGRDTLPRCRRSRTEFPRRTPVRSVRRGLGRGHADRSQCRYRGRSRHLGLPYPGRTRLLLPGPHRRPAFSDSRYPILTYWSN